MNVEGQWGSQLLEWTTMSLCLRGFDHEGSVKYVPYKGTNEWHLIEATKAEEDEQ